MHDARETLALPSGECVSLRELDSGRLIKADVKLYWDESACIVKLN